MGVRVIDKQAVDPVNDAIPAGSPFCHGGRRRRRPCDGPQALLPVCAMRASKKGSPRGRLTWTSLVSVMLGLRKTMTIKQFLLVVCLIYLNVGAADEKPKTRTDIDVLFSPNAGCTERIVQEINQARQRIRVQAYSFTSAPIAKSILEAKKRGVDCEVILDKSQQTQNYSELDFFFNQGVPTFIDDRHAIAHNKIILIDAGTVITGSFNFTKAAEESNAENLLIIKGDDDLARRYAENYATHREHSRAYLGRVETPASPRAPPTVQAVSQPATENAETTVYVTRTGAKYHRSGCSYLKSSIPVKLGEAKQRYGPCSRCRPPG